MFEWLSVSALNLVYFALMAVGVLYAIIILVGGALSNIDLPHIDIGAHGIDFGGAHVPDANIHVGADAGPDASHGEVSVRSLSAVSIASFVTAFGASGIIAIQLLEISPRWSLLIAAAGGLVVGAIVQLAFSYFLLAPQGSSEVRARDIMGAVGEVITPIPAGNVGEIAYVARGARVTSTARSADGKAIPRGTIVRVTNMVGSIVLVASTTPDAQSKEVE
jgi:hypothetical protein